FTSFSRDWSSDVCSSDLRGRRIISAFQSMARSSRITIAIDPTWSGIGTGPEKNGVRHLFRRPGKNGVRHHFFRRRGRGAASLPDSREARGAEGTALEAFPARGSRGAANAHRQGTRDNGSEPVSEKVTALSAVR